MTGGCIHSPPIEWGLLLSFPFKLLEWKNVAAEVDGSAEQLLHVLLQDADGLVHVHLLTRADPLPVEMFTICI